MAEKILNTRIQLKYDTLSNWQGSAFNGNDPTKYLKAGEVAIVTLAPNAETNPTATANQHPLLMKVGTGSHKFDALPWVSGLAADVYAWAKKATPDWADFPALPIEVVDEGTGKFVTDFTYVNNKLTITRADAVNSLTPTDDDIVILTVDKTTGDITIDGKHKEYNKAGTTTDTDSNLTTAGQEITVKIPKLSVDKYGHTEFNGETTHTIKLPGEIAVGDGDITIEAGKGLTTGGTFNVNQDTDSTITLNHQDAPTTGNAAVVKTGGTGRTYVTEVLVDDMGHIAGVKTATESDQDLGDYKTKQAEKSGTLTGAEVLGTWSQNANGEVTITSRILTAADLGLDTVMHFIGAYATAPTKAFAGTANERALANGDVYLNTANATEYVYSGGKWVELGNESAAGSHALKTVTITGTDGLEGGGDLSANRQIKHAVPTGAIEGKTTPNTAQTPAHGETFNIPVVKTDKFGHIIEKTTTTVKIPDLPTPADIGAVESVSFEAGIVVTKDADDAPTIPGFKLTVDGED